jgi:hypothetical protein
MNKQDWIKLHRAYIREVDDLRANARLRHSEVDRRLVNLQHANEIDMLQSRVLIRHMLDDITHCFNAEFHKIALKYSALTASVA